jgi:membrane associated rhomboid family serine protease
MFIAIPVGMNYRAERYPVVTLSLIGINTLVYLVSLFFFFQTDGESELWIVKHLWLIPSDWHWYASFTHMFVHAGLFHLLGNMIFLFLFGSCVEDIIGRLRFAVFYLVGGLVAEMAFIAMSPMHFMTPNPMGGASGAISACMGMYLLLRAGADIEFKYFFWFLYIRAGEFEIPAWVAISFWFLKDLFWAVLGLVNSHAGGGVAFGAHVGGFLAGLGMAGLYKLVHRQREEKIPEEIISMADVLAAAPAHREMPTDETPTIHLLEAGVQSGPFTLSQIQWRLSRNSIGRDALYWSEGMADWQSVLELAAHPLQ